MLGLGLLIATLAIPGPLRVDHQGGRLPAPGHRGDRAGRHLEVRLRAGREHRPPERRPRRRRRSDPISFLGDPNVVNWALIAVGTWASVGFATVILSAALKGIPTEIIEAARTDGANESQIFFRIILPMVSLPFSVLAVTLIVNVVKLFDLIYVMTNGGPGTSSRVIGYTFYVEGFQAGLFGKAAAVAVVMMVILIPIMIFNIRRFRTASVV